MILSTCDWSAETSSACDWSAETSSTCDWSVVKSSTCDWSAVKSSNCDWSAYEIVHMRLADPPPSHDESFYTPRFSQVQNRGNRTGQVSNKSKCFYVQDKTPPKVLIIICPKSAPSLPPLLYQRSLKQTANKKVARPSSIMLLFARKVCKIMKLC